MMVKHGGFVFGFVLVAMAWTVRGQTQEWSRMALADDGIRCMAAANAENVWAVAGVGTNTCIYYYDGNMWTLQCEPFASGTITGEVRKLYAFDADRVWGVGNSWSPQKPMVLVFDEGTWWVTNLTSINASFAYDMYSTDATNLWMVCNTGKILCSSNGGFDWAVETDTGSQIWQGIDGAGSNHIWVCGGTGVDDQEILFHDGSAWSTQFAVNVGSSRYLRDVEVVNWHDVWVGGDNGTILRFDGLSWGLVTNVGDTMNTAEIAAWSEDSLWFVFGGVDRGAYRWDGDRINFSTNFGGFSASGLVAAGPFEAWVGITSGNLYWTTRYPETSAFGLYPSLSWPSVRGSTYRVEWADALDSNTWFLADYVEATSDITTWADMGGTNRLPPSGAGQRLYRVNGVSD